MSFKVWCADESEAGAKLCPRDPPALGTMMWDRWARDAEDAAETYAEYFHNNRDGHECSWPVEFLVRDMATNVVHSFSVDRDYDPTFSAGGGDAVAPGPHDDVECPCGHPFGFAGPCVKAPGWGEPCKCVAPAYTAPPKVQP